MRRLLLLVMAVALVLAGCSDTSRDKDKDKGRPGAGKRPATVDGIPTATGTHKQELEVGTPGHREYLLHVPPKLTKGKWRDGKPATPLPLVLALHGGLANMSKMRQLTGFDRISDDRGFLVAYPDGFMTTWNAGGCCGAAKIGNIKDVAFLSKLIDRLTGSGLADPGRVFVSGFSNGAGMAYRLACEKPEKVAAIGVVEGALATPCSPDRPVSAMIFHGTADRSVPFGGGGRMDFNDGRPFPSVASAVEFWRKNADLPRPERGLAAKGVASTECETTGKGAGGAEVAFCTIDGGTHRWPDGASSALWDFFAAHPRVKQPPS
ncbi:alpha/beta hydrolase family esterase [Spirillospora sp. CA-294931]|uniref:alpha/beta hydrolase family esterase n=1 Tax=Spirillospora sp. CA-294931 TaxID=3240042 RepID=UPI003D935B84